MPEKRTIPRVCRRCGANFLTSVRAANQGKGFLCSDECRRDERRSLMVGRSLRPAVERITVACDYCKGPVTRRAREIKERNYCSRGCQGQGRPRPVPSVAILNEDGLTALLPLSAYRGKARSYAIIDAVDAEWAGRWAWHVDKDGYAVREERSPKRRRILLHRALLGLDSGDSPEGDHINRNRLDCRRANLRAIPGAGNRQNVPSQQGASSIYRGVTWDRQNGKWLAQVMVRRKNHCIGLFSDEAEAAEAARVARQRLLPYAVD